MAQIDMVPETEFFRINFAAAATYFCPKDTLLVYGVTDS